MEYLVTGATGHLGNTLIREILRDDPSCTIRAFVLPGADIRPLDGLPVKIVYGDVLDPQSIDRAMQGVEIVFHLAGIISIRAGQEDLTERVNIQGTQNVGASALRAGVRRMVHVASIHIFERIPTGVIDETTPLVTKATAAGIYDYTKAEAVRRLSGLIPQGLDLVIACPTGAIGPNDFLGSEMGTVFGRLLANSTHLIPRAGYDWVDVRDVAQGLQRMARLGITGELYILGGHYIRIGDFATMIAETQNSPCRIIYIPYPLMVIVAHTAQLIAQITGTKPQLTPYALQTLRSNVNFSHQKAIDKLGYSCRSADETVRDMIAWYSGHTDTDIGTRVEHVQ